MIVYIPNKIIELSKSIPAVKTELDAISVMVRRGKHKLYVRYNKDELIDCFPELKEIIEATFTELADTPLLPDYVVRISTVEEIESSDFENSKKYCQNNRLKVQRENTITEFISTKYVDSYLGQPLKIVLEDVDSDRLFIEKSLYLMNTINAKNIVENNQIEFPHGGGSRVPTLLESYNGKHRVICIVDSDKSSQEDVWKENSMQQKVIDISTVFGYSFHILQKSEMENYLPDVAIEKHLIENKNSKTDFAYFGLNHTHKDFFDMKKGLHGKHKKEVFWTDYFAFSIQTEKERENAQLKGFGDAIYKAFGYVETKQELLSRDRNSELNEIVNKIKMLI